MDRPSHCLSAVCNGASLRGLFMPLADSPGLRISPLLHLSPQRAHLPHVPPEPTAYCLLLTIETGDLLDLVKLQLSYQNTSAHPSATQEPPPPVLSSPPLPPSDPAP